MFQNLKNLLSKSINWDIRDDLERDSLFYPPENTQFDTTYISRTDYLKLYTGWVYTAVTTISDNMSMLKFQLKANKASENLINDPTLELITPQLIGGIVSFLQLNGSVFIYKEMIGNKVDSLVILRPDLVDIECHSDGSIKQYRYTANGKNYTFQKDEVIAIHLFNPLEAYPNKTKGVSPMQAVAIQMNTDLASNQWNWRYFRNNGSVKDILESDGKITAETARRIEADWNNKYRGVNNSHKLAVLSGGLKYKSVSPSQKEMDFVDSRRFTRDEVLAVFKVPKAIIGAGEGTGGTLNVGTYEKIFAKRVLLPMANLIADVFNKELFNGIGHFEFVNVVPADTEEARKNLEAGAITINEYRNIIGKDPIEGGDVLKLNITALSGEVAPKEEEKHISSTLKKSFKSIVRSNIKGTEEFEEKRQKKAQENWEKKIQRNNTYEEKYVKAINNIFEAQKRDLTMQVEKSVKKAQKPKFDTIKYLTLWQATISPLQKEVIQNEGNQALEDIGLVGLFKIGETSVNKFMRDNIHKFAKEVDNFTKEQMIKIVEKGNEEGLSAAEISRNISSKFDEFKRTRSLKIARTETIRAGTYATQKAWEDSEIVEGKEWYTAIDERVCPNCGPLHGKTIKLREDFFKKGETAPGGLKLDYETIKGAPLHPQCRCTLLPVIED